MKTGKERAMGPAASKKSRDRDLGATYFLGIGIDTYQHWPPLHNAVSDVQAIAKLLKEDYGLNNSYRRILLNEEATESNIISTLEELSDEIKEEDSLLIYYAGHGHLNNKGRGFWIPVDAPKEQVFRYIRNSTIRDYIGDIKGLHTLLISDSCFSGSLFMTGVERSNTLAAEELSKLPSRWAICSGRHDEVVADGPTNGHSPFAESILEVLSTTSREIITAGLLVNQVIELTRANYDQLPDGGPLQGVGHKRGQFIFRRQKGKLAASLWGKIESGAENSIKEVKAKTQLIDEYLIKFPKGSHSNEVLEKGEYLTHKLNFIKAYDRKYTLQKLLKEHTPFEAEITKRLDELRLLEDVKEPKPKPVPPIVETKNNLFNDTTTPDKDKGKKEITSPVLPAKKYTLMGIGTVKSERLFYFLIVPVILVISSIIIDNILLYVFCITTDKEKQLDVSLKALPIWNTIVYALITIISYNAIAARNKVRSSSSLIISGLIFFLTITFISGPPILFQYIPNTDYFGIEAGFVSYWFMYYKWGITGHILLYTKISFLVGALYLITRAHSSKSTF